MQALQRFHESNVLAAKISEVFRPKVIYCERQKVTPAWTRPRLLNQTSVRLMRAER